MATNFDLFRRAERIETLAAAIYGALAKRFHEHEEARELFARLEAEELQHATRVRLLAASYRSDPKLLVKVNGAAELEGCVKDAEDALDDVESGRWGTDLGDVKQRLALLEVRLATAHANVLAMNGDGELREFFEQLARMDDAHVQLLADG